MEDISDSQPMIEIQVVGWTWTISPKIRMVIDGARVGVLTDKSAGRSPWPRAFTK